MLNNGYRIGCWYLCSQQFAGAFKFEFLYTTVEYTGYALICPMLVVQGVTDAVLPASGFSPLWGDAHPPVTGSAPALRDDCNLYRHQCVA